MKSSNLSKKVVTGSNVLGGNKSNGNKSMNSNSAIL